VTQTCKNTFHADPCCCGELADLLSPRFFKALGDPNRIAILQTLAGCCTPMTVGKVAECCPVDVSVVSRHLATLRDAGVLEVRRRGKEVFYSVRFENLAALLRRMADAIDACCSTVTADAGKGEPK
jgi:ArsR family transcriptional regulator